MHTMFSKASIDAPKLMRWASYSSDVIPCCPTQGASNVMKLTEKRSLAGFIPIVASLLAFYTAASSGTEVWQATNTKALEAREAVQLGAMPSDEKISITLALNLRNKNQLIETTAKILSGASTRIMPREEFANLHAPTSDQAARAVLHLQQHGFQNIVVAENRLLVTADGTVGTIKEAFQAELYYFNANGRLAYANVTDAQIPPSLSGIVSAILGLQTVHMARTNHVVYQEPPLKAGAYSQGFNLKAGAPVKYWALGASPKTVSGLSPTQFASIYGASSLPSATNATIGIITNGNVSQTITDLKSFAASAGYPVPPISVVQVGVAGTDTSGIGEWNLDTQSSLAAAGGTIRQMLLYNGATLSDADLANAFNKAVTDNKARVINVSLGECENDANTSGFRATGDAIFQTAVSQGQTFSVSSGDSGSYSCGGTTSYQSYPAVSPYVMSIGGTTLSTTSSTWVGETVWSCTGPTDCPQSASGGTGGGVSATENAASWQVSSGVLGGSTKRGVPDIAFDASPSSGARILVNGATQQIGGTSLAAPLFTGFYSRIQSANNNTLPFPAATLYQGAASHPNWFHDVTSGSNGGYSAKTGWDYTTGYGSLIVANFATAFSGAGGTGGTPTANFSFLATGLTVNFTDTSIDTGGAIGSHAWNFGDSTTSTATNPNHIYAAAGSYAVTETVTDSINGSTSSKTTTITVSSVATSSQLLGNTGFEATTAAPWTISSAALCSNSTCPGETAHAGTNFVWLDGYGSTHTESASQAVTITAGKTTASLTFYLHIDTAETGTTAYDKLSVQVLGSTGAVLGTLATYSNANAAPGYALKTLDMSAYIGKTVTIKFTGTEDASLQTSFVLDDITITVR